MKKLTHKELGRLGGNATKKKHGKKHFAKAGRKGAYKMWDNIRVQLEAAKVL